MADADPLAAELKRIGDRHKAAYVSPWAMSQSGADVPRLLAAVEAALAEAAKWKRLAVPGDAQDECADGLREAITRALLGEATPAVNDHHQEGNP
jgi:hypothetical protein